MNCITRNDMKFGDYFIPARTKATVVNRLTSVTVDAPGIHLKLAITLWDMMPMVVKERGVPISRTRIDNELESNSFKAKSSMVGIAVDTDATQVYMDAGDRFYSGVTLREWQAKKIFGGVIPEGILRREHGDDYYLESIVEYLDEEFAEWVKKNCHFCKLTKNDIECGGCFDGAEPGDKTLSATGMEQFDAKKLEYQAQLETIGFTYDFKGGLIWD